MRHRPLPTLRAAAAAIIVLGLAARLVALLREVMIAQSFGVGPDLDAVYLGLAIPTAIVVAIGGGLSKVVVAIVAGLDQEASNRLLKATAGALIRWLLPLSILMAITAPLWVNVLRLGTDSPAWVPTAAAAAIGALMLVGGALAGLYQGTANAAGRHFFGSLNPIAYNLIVCVVIYMLADSLGALSLAVGLLAAEWLQVVVLVPIVGPMMLRAGIARRETREELARLGKLCLPAVLIGLATGLNVAIDRMFATTLEAGAIAALSYGERLVNVPVGLLGTALAVPLFTRLSRHHGKGDNRLYRQTIWLAVVGLVVVGVPLGALAAVASAPAVGLLLERGAFDSRAVELSATALTGYALSIPFQALAMLLTAAGLLGNRAWTTVGILLAVCLLNAGLDALLVGPFGVLGLALATTLATALKVLLLLRLVLPGWHRSVVVPEVLKALIQYGMIFGLLIAVGSFTVGNLAGDADTIGARLLLLGVYLSVSGVSFLLSWRWNPGLADRISHLRAGVAAGQQSEAAE